MALRRCCLGVLDEVQPFIDPCDGVGRRDRQPGGIRSFGEARPPMRMEGHPHRPGARWDVGCLGFGGAGGEDILDCDTDLGQ